MFLRNDHQTREVIEKYRDTDYSPVSIFLLDIYHYQHDANRRLRKNLASASQQCVLMKMLVMTAETLLLIVYQIFAFKK